VQNDVMDSDGPPSPGCLDARERDRVLDRLERERFDLAVVGGGISGAGVAALASRRGLDVALLEADDFAAGTSSRSSKLIHGGLRYLAQGEVALVRTTALERKALHRIAPHLAEPRWMVVPTRSRAALLKLRAAIATYEKLGAVEEADRHRNWVGEELAREEPLVRRGVHPFACAYREYLTDDARLVLANLRAAAGCGAAALNHAPVEAIAVESGRAAGVEIACRESGRRVRVRARCVVNAAGPWVEALQRLEDPGAAPLLHLSKGVHVALPAERLPLRNLLILTARDRRQVFAIPRDGCTYVGTTDTSHPAGAALWPGIDAADVEYLLEPLARSLATEPVRPDEVVAAWAGLRPLVAEPGKAPQELSRRDELRVGPAGVVTLAGGKLTGYRPMARQTLERAAAECALALAPAPADDAPLPGGDFAGELGDLAGRLARAAGLEAGWARRLARLYGAEAFELLRGGAAPLAPGVPVAAAEVDWAVTREAATHLEDVVYRRLRTAWFVPEARDAALEPAAARMAALLGWSQARRAAEVEAARARLASELDFAPAGAARAGRVA
jgi:glycerol-3-phosphate dehydrogenase